MSRSRIGVMRPENQAMSALPSIVLVEQTLGGAKNLTAISARKQRNALASPPPADDCRRNRSRQRTRGQRAGQRQLRDMIHTHGFRPHDGLCPRRESISNEQIAILVDLRLD